MSLQTLFNPKSIAVIGASTSPGAVGHIILKNLVSEHFPGKIFPVNPKATELLGLTCYATVNRVQEPIELAIIVVPAKIVPGVLQEVAEKKIPNAIIISAGFKEAGVAGKVLEQQIKDIALKNNITLLGPNCLGFLHGSRSLNASFAKELGKNGPITFFSQSGALCTTLLDETKDTLGYAHFVSIGNKAIVKEKELLEYFIEDPETGLIAFYTEDLEDSQALVTLGRQAITREPLKPLIVLKSGTTDQGKEASSSHTGAVAGSDLAYNALFHQARITRAKSLAHLVELLEVFSKNTPPLGNRVAIITNAGGMGVLATDCAVQSGLVLSSLAEKSTQRLSLGLPAAAGIHNPIDVLGDAPPDRYLLALETAINDPGVDSLMVIVTPQAMTEGEKTAEVITKLAAHTEKPIVTVFTDGATLAPARLLLQKAGVATLTHAENAARALGNLTTVAHWQTLDNERAHSVSPFKKEAAKILKNTTPHANGYLTEEDTRKLLGLYGFIFPKTIVLTAEAEAHAASKEFSSPVVLKIISPDIIHKTDAGGVLLNVAPQDITLAYQTILANTKKNAPEAKMTGVLAAEMIPSTTPEILLGVKTESTLGKLVVAGLGGIYVEVFKDVAARFSPLTEQDAEEMLQELKAWPVLAGTRGQEGIPLKELEARILALSLLVADCPQISELDINPLVYNAQKGFVCLDARIRLEAS